MPLEQPPVEPRLTELLQPVLISLGVDELLPIPARVARQRLMAREALARCAQLCGAPADGWQQAPSGAPLPNQGFYWSVSHKPLLVGAVISNQPVGIDIEHIRPRGNQDLWNRLADDAEWTIAGERSWETFFRLWTAKEAVLKANSRGISGLNDCRIVSVPNPSCINLCYRDQAWRVEQLYHRDHVVALTVDDQQVTWHFSHERRDGLQS